MKPCRFIVFAILGLVLAGCRTSNPVFSELAVSRTTTEDLDRERGPYADIMGVRVGTQQQEVASAIISALHRSHVLRIAPAESDAERCGKEAAIWILRGDTVSISLTNMLPDEIQLALHDLRAAGLTVNLSE